MDFDLTDDERDFIVRAIHYHLESFPEYADRMERFADLLEDCGEVGTTLHVN